MKAKIRALTNKTSQQDRAVVLKRINMVLRGWSNYFRHAVGKHTFRRIAQYAWWRATRWLRTLHRWTWKQFRRQFTEPSGRWKPLSAEGTAPQADSPDETSITR